MSYGLVAKSCPALATPWTVACQAPLSVGFSRQEHWSGLPFPSPGDLPNPWTQHGSPTLQADSLPSELPGKPTRTSSVGVGWKQGAPYSGQAAENHQAPSLIYKVGRLIPTSQAVMRVKWGNRCLVGTKQVATQQRLYPLTYDAWSFYLEAGVWKKWSCSDHNRSPHLTAWMYFSSSRW